jgi:hypothetical protein
MRRASQGKTVGAGDSLQPTGRKSINFDTVREIGRVLPGVQDSSAYGRVALKVHGKLLACEATNRSAEPGSLVLRVGSEDRAQLLAEAPDVYYLPEHYVAYSAVLVRLSRVDREVLRDLLGMAYKFVTRNTAPRSRARKHRKTG